MPRLPYLVRHGRRADLAGDRALAEVADRDVGPDVAVEVEQDGIEAGQRVAQLGDVVVWLDLDGVGVPVEAEPRDETLGERRPVHLGVGRQVGVEVANRAVDLAEHRHRGELRALPREAVHDVGELLAERRWRGRLAVGAREHRQVGEVVGQCAQRIDQLVGGGQQGLVARLAQHQRVGEVVNVLGGAGEVDELGDRLELGVAGDALLEEVLDRLDVVIGRALDVLDALGILLGEAVEDAVEQAHGMFAQRRHLGDARLVREGLEPADLDQDAMPDKAIFTEDGP
jgi:glutathione S-transferase